jgi:hypothetical protein
MHQHFPVAESPETELNSLRNEVQFLRRYAIDQFEAIAAWAYDARRKSQDEGFGQVGDMAMRAAEAFRKMDQEKNQ